MLTISYLMLRRAIGVLGMALPFVLIVGHWLLGSSGIESSISAYYYTDMRDVFVGTLCVIGVFLWSYRGYPKSRDNITANVAAIGAIGTALVPTNNPLETPAHAELPAFTRLSIELTGYNLHPVFAAVCLLALAFFCLCLFTRSNNPTPEKQQRNIIYRTCGVVILLCLALIAIYLLAEDAIAESVRNALDVVFWLETIALVSFGFAWFVKGETLFKDR
jgi:hypothetical protein